MTLPPPPRLPPPLDHVAEGFHHARRLVGHLDAQIAAAIEERPPHRDVLPVVATLPRWILASDWIGLPLATGAEVLRAIDADADTQWVTLDGFALALTARYCGAGWAVEITYGDHAPLTLHLSRPPETP